MAVPIGIHEVCTALESASEMLAAPDREQVRSLLRSTSPASRALCLFPLQINAPVEVWSDGIYAPRPEEKDAPEQVCTDVLLPVGWMCFLRPSSLNVQVGSLAELVDAFHFFAALRPAVLRRLKASLAEQITVLQRIRPAIALELCGDEVTFTPPAAFGAVGPDVIALSAMSPFDTHPEAYGQHPFDPLNEAQATVVVLYGTASKMEPDPAMSLTRTL